MLIPPMMMAKSAARGIAMAITKSPSYSKSPYMYTTYKHSIRHTAESCINQLFHMILNHVILFPSLSIIAIVNNCVNKLLQIYFILFLKLQKSVYICVLIMNNAYTSQIKRQTTRIQMTKESTERSRASLAYSHDSAIALQKKVDEYNDLYDRMKRAIHLLEFHKHLAGEDYVRNKVIKILKGPTVKKD